MLTVVPSFARPTFAHYEASGTLPGLSERVDLSQGDAAAHLEGLTEQFIHWRELDESPADQLKGLPGEVRIVSSEELGGYEQASFRGDEKDGELLHVDNTPNMHYGFIYADLTRFSAESVESVSVGASVQSNTVLGTHLTHLDRSGGGFSLYARQS